MARYEESLAWLRRVPPEFAVTVYAKGDAPVRDVLPEGVRRHRRTGQEATVVALPNVGREAHTYLHHIVSHYGSLSKVSVFCQGRPFDHAWDFHSTLRDLAVSTPPLGQDEWRWLGHTIDTDTSDGALFRSWSKNPTGEGLDLAGFHEALLGGQGPLEYAFVLGGQLAATREVIIRRPLAFWERALEMSASWPHAAHCFERLWDRVVGAPGPGPHVMQGRRTIHLKRMKRQEPA